MRALVAEGRMEDALAYAEASRGLNQPDTAIDAACEKILLDLGRVDEAYEKYALTANGSSTGLATFRAIVRKYPGRDPKKILLDLASIERRARPLVCGGEGRRLPRSRPGICQRGPHRSAHVPCASLPSSPPGSSKSQPVASLTNCARIRFSASSRPIGSTRWAKERNASAFPGSPPRLITSAGRCSSASAYLP